MFIIEVTYTRPLEVVNLHLEEHRRFLKEQQEAGFFIAAGRQIPPVGGIILANADSKETIEKILDKDPFKVAGVADYRVIEFTPRLYDEALATVVGG